MLGRLKIQQILISSPQEQITLEPNLRMTTQSYLSAIEQLIVQNQTVKSTNRKLTSLIEQLLDGIVHIFTQFFPSVKAYDSNSIFKAGEEIFSYYRKQLMIIKSELCNSLLQILNVYDIKVEDGMDSLEFDDWREFINSMKTSKTSVLEQLNQARIAIKQTQLGIERLEQQLNHKQLQLKKLSIEQMQKQSQIHRLSSTNELLTLQVRNLVNQVTRANDQLQTMQVEFNTAEVELNQLYITNEELRRKILYLERDKAQRANVLGREQSRENLVD